MHPLDRPIWTALSTRQAEFAVGGPLALRYKSDVEPFAAVESDTEENLEALAQLLKPGETHILLQAQPSPLPPGIRLTDEAAGVQMVAATTTTAPKPPEAIRLSDADSAEMLELAELTRPGPFRPRTHCLGNFWGIRREGQLVSMAGERMKIPGLTEVSGVATHPDWRGHGFARSLSAFVASEITRRGEIPFLHAFADNAAAIRLYETLGFTIRAAMHVQIIGLE
ncbi:MAG TPA: GNAT family N-acetyltransferase [Sphingomicrobium sp.]|nr:GNAT family N-acetyltransferase [Sphingomicrobium sp.]